MKIKAKAKKGVVKVKMLIKHAMETGRRKDATGKLIPAKHITEVTAKYQNQVVFHAETGTAVSKDPYIAFVFKGESGQDISISWIDTSGATDTATSLIK